ncbi:MAG: MBL fold metallo-hydrolase [Rubricoccaceae bacterium]|nr:MBL fold metallo-hydrolase [Rubricoccaceae bacterium]
MKLTFWGAARTVTGSQHLVTVEHGEAAGRQLLLDCGLYQGRRAEANARNRSFAADPAALEAVVLSHAHIDHSGLLPRLWREGFRGTVYCTHATRDLCALMLRDSGYIQEKDAEFYNRRIRKKGEPAVEPLYDVGDAEGVMEHFVSVPYDYPFAPLPGVEGRFRDAGHILGSATVTLTVEEEGREKRLGFTGDIGNPGRPILRDPAPMLDCDWLICESTYGGKTHEPAGQAKDRLAEVIGRTAARGGKVIVPAFAVGRTQELVYALDQLWNEERIPRIPVFVDSPLAVNVTGVFRSHPECYDRELLDYMLTDDNPFGFERLEYVREASRSKELNGMAVPMVILSASGMAEAGRILHHLRNNVEDPKSTVVVVGFMAEHTLGRRIVERREEIKIFGQPHRLRAEVAVLNYFSAHADEPGILDFVGTLDRERLQSVFLVHGDEERQVALRGAMQAGGYGDVQIPAQGETVAL